MSADKKPVTARQVLLAAALAATVAATMWAAQIEPEEVVSPALSRPTRATAGSSAPPPTRWAPVERAPWPEPSRDQLAAWGPPPVPSAAPLPPLALQPEAEPAPVAPPFPYQLIGRIEEGGISQALLAGGSRSLNAKAGDVIDGQWRVERVDASGLGLLWLPGQQPQTITFRPS